jgi:hypothetical protein
VFESATTNDWISSNVWYEPWNVLFPRDDTSGSGAGASLVGVGRYEWLYGNEYGRVE